MARRAAAAAATAVMQRRSRSSAAAVAAAEQLLHNDGGDEDDSAAQGATPATNTPGAESPAADEDEDEEGANEQEYDDEEEEENNRGSSSIMASTQKPKFVLVSDHGQTALVPASKANHYRTLAGRPDDSEASTPALELKKRLVRIPIKRGPGRPPKTAPRYEVVEEVVDDDAAEDDDDDGDDADASTAMVATGRAGREILPVAMEMNVFVNGKEYLLKNDELVLDSDEAGDTKVDAKGNLLGGRELTFPTFVSPQRPDPTVRYALSIDAAKGAGYRDSFNFYRWNPLLLKLACTDQEKAWCIANGRLPPHLRTRSVNMVAVRNVYKLHGAKVVVGGRQVIDDYYEQQARDEGKVEGRVVGSAAVTVDEDAAARIAGSAARTAERRQREAERDRDRSRRRQDAFTHATTDMHGNPWYTTFGDTGESPFERAKSWPARRTNALRAEMDEDNWMMEMAASVRGMNRELLLGRADRLSAFGRPYEGIEGLPEQEQKENAYERERQRAEHAERERQRQEAAARAAQEEYEMAKLRYDARVAEAARVAAEASDEFKPATPAEGVQEPPALPLPPVPPPPFESRPPIQIPPKKRKAVVDYLPVGMYEPLTNAPHYMTSTQSSRAKIERVGERPILEKDAAATTTDADGDATMAGDAATTTGRPAKKTRAVLGGSIVGAHAWGVASIEQRVQLPLPKLGQDVRLEAGASAKEMEM